jgi:O-antigen/teichoic acid export membrane protein
VKILKIKILNFYQKSKVYLENTSWTMAERVLNIGVVFLVTIFVARYLGPEQFGVFAYATSLVSIFAIAGQAGLGGLVVRELCKYPDDKQEIMGTSFVLKGFGYLIGLTLLLVFILVTENTQKDEFWVLLILATTLLFQPFKVIDFWFQSRLEIRYTAIAKTTALIIVSIIKIALVFGGAHLILFAFVNVIQVAVVAIMLILFYRYKSKLSLTTWQFSSVRAKELLSQGWLVFLGTIFSIIYLKVDQIMLKWIAGAEEVGVYAVAASLSEAWYFVPVAIIMSFFPKLVKLKENNPVCFSKRLQQLFDLLFILALGVAIVVTLVAQPLITMTFGETYQVAANILMIHIWSAPFIFMRAVFSKWILIENMLMFSMITQGSGVLINVALNYWLIPHYGGIGAAYATLFSYAVASYFALLVHSKTRPVFWMMTKSIFSPIRYIVYILRR